MIHFIQNFLIVSGIAFWLIAITFVSFVVYEEFKQWRLKRIWDKYNKAQKGE